MAGEVLKKSGGLGAGGAGTELFFQREDVALEPGKKGLGVAGDGGVLRQVGVDVDEAGNEDGLGGVHPADVQAGVGGPDLFVTTVRDDVAVFHQ